MSSSDPSTQELERGLANRHVQLIAIGGAIGTGLFMGSGKTISLAGPSILLVYAIIGLFLFFFMRLMGELLLAHPDATTFSDVATRYIGPWGGFTVSWVYWLCWIVTGIADMVAITGYFQFWWPDIPVFVPVTMTVVLLFALNAMTVKSFGETEFWFAMVKIVAIVALIVVGIYLVATHYVQPGSGSRAAVSNLWNYGGIFPNGWGGFITGFQIALFAFVGIELVGTAVAETEDPEKTLPKAINAIPVRVVLFYLASLALIMMVTPWNEISPNESPFVQMFSYTGLPFAASVINLVVITSAASSANSGIYSTSRMLYGLAHSAAAPKIFGKLSAKKVPLSALAFSCVLLFSSIILLETGDSVIGAFTVATSASATLFMVVWTFITVCYLVYRGREPQLHDASTFRAPGGSISAYAVLGFFGVMCVFLLMAADTAPGFIAAVLVTALLAGIGRVLQARRVNGGGTL